MDWAILKKPAATIAGLLGKHPISPSQAPGQEYGSYSDSLFAQCTRVVNMVAFPVRIKKQNLVRNSVDYLEITKLRATTEFDGHNKLHCLRLQRMFV